MPRFSFFISHSKEPVTEDSLIWQAPIPLRLDALMKDDGQGESVSHAAYFRAVQSFLETNAFEVLTRALSQKLHREVKAPDISEIGICLEKHGEYYHPSRIETVVDRKPLFFVLNVAISNTGLRFIEEEYQLLKRLNTALPFGYLPQVYGFGQTPASAGLNFGMFLGQWFDRFHEFHISMDPEDQKPKICVWDDAGGRFFLSAGQTQALYARASKILTAYYNLESFEQIFSWHHAAGDFIVKAEDEELELRLVTVRRYHSIFENQTGAQPQQGNPQRILQALLVFFLNLSLHMRLDRLDGTGQMVWSDPIAVEATLTGFLEALSMKPDIPSLPDSPLACFAAYMASCSQADLFDLTETIVKRFKPQMPGLALVKNNLHPHVEALHTSIQQFL